MGRPPWPVGPPLLPQLCQRAGAVDHVISRAVAGVQVLRAPSPSRLPRLRQNSGPQLAFAGSRAAARPVSPPPTDGPGSRSHSSRAAEQAVRTGRSGEEGKAGQARESPQARTASVGIRSDTRHRCHHSVCDSSPAASTNAWSAWASGSASVICTRRRYRAILRRRCRMTAATRSRPVGVSASHVALRSLARRKRCMKSRATRRSHSRVAVDGATPISPAVRSLWLAGVATIRAEMWSEWPVRPLPARRGDDAPEQTEIGNLEFSGVDGASTSVADQDQGDLVLGGLSTVCGQSRSSTSTSGAPP
jgi:hypothetical protein